MRATLTVLHIVVGVMVAYAGYLALKDGYYLLTERLPAKITEN